MEKIQLLLSGRYERYEMNLWLSGISLLWGLFKHMFIAQIAKLHGDTKLSEKLLQNVLPNCIVGCKYLTQRLAVFPLFSLNMLRMQNVHVEIRIDDLQWYFLWLAYLGRRMLGKILFVVDTLLACFSPVCTHWSTPSIAETFFFITNRVSLRSCVLELTCLTAV